MGVGGGGKEVDQAFLLFQIELACVPWNPSFKKKEISGRGAKQE